jgi:hypothetical protein
VSLESDLFPPLDYNAYDPIGIMGYYVCLVGIRYVILRYEEISYSDTLFGSRGLIYMMEPTHAYSGIFRYIENLSSVNATAPWLLDSNYQLCLRKLSQWSTSLPPSLRLSRDNIFSRHRTPHLGPLVILHLWSDMLHCELYRLALQTHSDERVRALFATAPTGWVNETQDLCVHHAVNIVRILRVVEDNLGHTGFAILDPSLAMLCYASMKIQLLYASARESLGLDMDVSEMVENFKTLLLFVERLSRYFRPTMILVSLYEPFFILGKITHLSLLCSSKK